MKKEKKNKKEVVKEEKEVVEKKKRPFLSKLIFVAFLFLLVYIYARYVGTTGLAVREYNITDANIPESFDGFSILQFSDLEMGSTYSIDMVEKLAEKINSLDPDIVVFTGDFAKYSYSPSEEQQDRLKEAMDSIDPEIAKYSVRGDDDYEDSLYDQILLDSGFKDITNSYELIYYKGLTPIVLYGLGSLNSQNQDFESTFSYPGNLEDTTYMATYRILLAHEPDTISSVGEYNISLMLSGHSHNSEINIPYLKELYKIKGATNYYDQKYNVSGTRLYISGGLGTSKYKVRLFDRPSISIYRLYTE